MKMGIWWKVACVTTVICRDHGPYGAGPSSIFIVVVSMRGLSKQFLDEGYVGPCVLQEMFLSAACFQNEPSVITDVFHSPGNILEVYLTFRRAQHGRLPVLQVNLTDPVLSQQPEFAGNIISVGG